MATKPKVEDADTEQLTVGGPAFEEMLKGVNVAEQMKNLKTDILGTRSVTKKDQMVKRLQYLAGLKKLDEKPAEAYILHNIPVTPPIVRPPIQMGSNRIEYADANMLYKDHMLVNNTFKDIKDLLPNDQLTNERKALYEGAKAIMWDGDAITGSSRGKQLKGYVKQIAGSGMGPKGGFFQSKLLSKKQDFSGRATIYAEPNLGFNQAAVPKDMLWQMYEFHIIRDLVRNGYDYVEAKKAVEKRTPAAVNSFNKMIETVPVIINRAPTLMRTNITAHMPVPVDGKTIGINPLHLPMYAGDYDGDAVSIHVPLTPEAVDEAKKKLLPQSHLYDYRKGQMAPMIQPGHEAIVGSMYMTDPDTTQETKHFKNEKEVIEAMKRGEIMENTPVVVEDDQ